MPPNDYADLPHDDQGVASAGKGWAAVRGTSVRVRVNKHGADLQLPDAAVAEGSAGDGSDFSGGKVSVRLQGPSDQRVAPLLLRVDPATRPASSSEKAEAVPAGSSVSGIDVELDYSDFAEAFGAMWSSRLAIRAYPACYVDTPTAPGCSDGVDVAIGNDPIAQYLSFTTIAASEVPGTLEADIASSGAGGAGTLARAASGPVGGGGGVVYALASTPGGLGAVPEANSLKWQVAPGSGEYSTSYPFAVPDPLATGAVPNLALTYSSGAVDAMTSDGAQGSQAGVGWDLNPGYITRSYVSCDDDGLTGKHDLCWKTVTDNGQPKVVEDFSIVLNGQSTSLWRVTNGQGGTTNRLRTSTDTGWNVREDPSGDRSFRVMTPDGWTYWFGQTPSMNSVLKVPVYGNNAPEPCHQAGSMANSWCSQGWRWYLDKAVDPNGNTISYSYTKETNYYQRYGGGGGGTATQYDRAGNLSVVGYANDAQSGFRGAVWITTLDRCAAKITNKDATCAAVTSSSDWPDVPGDLVCGGGTCTQDSPSFFSTKRYYSLETGVRSGSSVNNWQSVDRYYFQYAFLHNPSAVAEPTDLFLYTIERRGIAYSADPGLSLGWQYFFSDSHASAQPNRVAAGPSGATLKHYRLRTMLTQTGARTDVEYGHQAGRNCNAAYVSGRDRWNSARECYAQWNDATSSWEWFHKYVTIRVAFSDNALGHYYGQTADSSPSPAQLQVFDYEYQGDPAWRYNPSHQITSNHTSWDDWRGYERSRVLTRNTANQVVVAGSKAVTDYVVFRGMNWAKDGTSGSYYDNYELQSLLPDELPIGDPKPRDHKWLQGRVALEANYQGDGSTLIDRSYHGFDDYSSADIVNPTAVPFSSHAQHPHVVWEKLTEESTQTPSGLRRRQITRVADGASNPAGIEAGLITQVKDAGNPGSADDICVTTDWVTNTTNADQLIASSKWIRKPSLTTTLDGGCSGTVQAKQQTFYDTTATPPSPTGLTAGNPTANRSWTSTSNSFDTRAVYDSLGRVISATDGNGNTVATAYNPASPVNNTELVAAVRTTQPTGLVSTVTLDPRRGQPLSTVDPNGQTTSMAYDLLGRPLTVTTPTVGVSNGVQTTYSYQVSNSAPSRVKIRTKRDSGTTYATSDDTHDNTYVFYDGWGREIERQERAPGSTPGSLGAPPERRLVTATSYDDRGLVWRTTGPVANTITVSGVQSDPYASIVNPNYSSVDHYTETSYDALGRPSTVADKSGSSSLTTNTVQSTYTGEAITTTSYSGATLTPGNQIGGATLTALDYRGRTTSVTQQPGPGDAFSPVTAAYTYRATGELASITGAGGKTWTYGYDWLGRRINTVDPDTGHSTSAFDNNGNQTNSKHYSPNTIGGGEHTDTDLTTTYDDLNRPLSRVDNLAPSGQALLAQWTYGAATAGVNFKGRPISATSHNYVNGGQDYAFTTTVNGYDNRGRVTGTTRSYPNSLTGETADPATPGLAAKAEALTYNDLDQVATHTYSAAPGIGTLATATAYTDNGNPAATYASVNGGAAVVTESRYYDTAGRVYANISGDGGSGVANNLARVYGWDNATDRLGWQTATRFDASGGYKTVYQGLGYTYDALGRIRRIDTSRQDVLNGTVKNAAVCYTYDGLNRLATAHAGIANPNNATGCQADASTATTQKNVLGDVYNLTYAYGPDNLASVTATGGPTRTYAYNTGTHQANAITSTGSGATAGLPTTAQFGYDTNGRMTTWQPTGTSPSTRLVDYYPTGDQRTSITVNGDLALPQNAIFDATTNLYDTDGIRTARVSTTINNPILGSLAGLLGQGGFDLGTLGLNLINSASTTTVYLGDTEIIKTPTGATSRRVIPGAGGTPLATYDTTGWTWLAADHTGSTRVAARRTSQTIEWTNYYPYGDPIRDGTIPSPTALTAGRSYLAKPIDPNGDTRLDHRAYDPTPNILTTPDPLLDPSDPQSLNPYAYARNNPIGMTDPSGLEPKGEDGLFDWTQLHDDSPMTNGPQPQSTSYGDQLHEGDSGYEVPDYTQIPVVDPDFGLPGPGTPRIGYERAQPYEEPTVDEDACLGPDAVCSRVLRIGRSAVDWATTGTKGVCVGGSGGFVAYGGLSGCFAVHDGDIAHPGFTLTPQFGGGFGASGITGAFFSDNRDSIADLQGVEGFWGGGYLLTAETSGSNGSFHGYSIGYGAGFWSGMQYTHVWMPFGG